MQEILDRGMDQFNNHSLCILTRSFSLFATFQQTSNVVKMDDVELEKSDGMDKLLPPNPFASMNLVMQGQRARAA